MKLVPGQPRYTHSCKECSACTWLGQHRFYDLYACRTEARGVVLVARYADAAWGVATLSLKSYLVLGRPEDLIEPFNIAFTKATQRGIV